jgi:2-polyprenyl-3-methyl-5-hydroxy-6-metoxy-1,4-benzoquinol methylase
MPFFTSIKPETERRKVHIKFDNTPSIHHKFNFKFSKNIIKNKQVLDVGCWTGQFEMLAAPYTKSIIGIDPNKEAILYAKKNVLSSSFQVGNALNVPFNKSTFDVVLFLDVLEHLPKNTELTALKEINRVLKSNATLILSTPNYHPLSNAMDPAFFLIGHRHYSLHSLQQMLNSTGFSIVKTHQAAGLITFLAINLDLFYKHILNKELNYPSWMTKRIYSEYIKGGFGANYVIAKKL